MRELVLAVALCLGVTGTATDPCEKGCPVSLWKAVRKEYPAFRLSLLTDLSEHERELYASEGAGRCPGIAAADFFGDRKTSYGLLLRTGKDAVVVAARRVAEGWRLIEVDRIPDGSVSAVFAEPPGDFEDISTGERLSSSQPVVHVVKYESSSIVYIWRNSKFHPVFLKD